MKGRLRANRFLFSAIWRMKARRLGAHVLRCTCGCGSLLDFGAGNMVMARYLRDHSRMKVTCIDVVDNNLTDLPLLLYGGEKLPFDDDSFDATLAVFVLHHCRDPRAALRELCRVTRGKVVLIEESYANPLQRRVLEAHDWVVNRLESREVDVPMHFLTMPAWRSLFEELGLKLEGVTRVRQAPLLNLTWQVCFELAKRRSVMPCP